MFRRVNRLRQEAELIAKTQHTLAKQSVHCCLGTCPAMQLVGQVHPKQKFMWRQRRHIPLLGPQKSHGLVTEQQKKEGSAQQRADSRKT